MTDYRRERQCYVCRAGGDEGGQWLRWEDCVKRDVRKAGEEEDWKKEVKRHRRVKNTIISYEGGEEVVGSTSPLTKGKRGDDYNICVSTLKTCYINI